MISVGPEFRRLYLCLNVGNAQKSHGALSGFSVSVGVS